MGYFLVIFLKENPAAQKKAIQMTGGELEEEPDHSPPWKVS